MTTHSFTASDLEAAVARIAARVLFERGLAPSGDVVVHIDANFGADGLGLDSMGHLELLVAVEQELGLQVPEDHWRFAGGKTLRDLITELTTGI